MSATTSASFTDAIRMNNNGITFVLGARHDRAASCFFRALGILKIFLSGANDKEEPARPSSLHTSSDPVSGLRLHTASYAVPLHHDSGYCLSNRVIWLSPSPTSEPVESDDCHVFCSVIILNTAVLYHLMAHESDDQIRRTKCLRRAETFYEMAARILSGQHSPETKVDQHCTGLIAHMIALNNLANIQMQRGDMIACGTTFEKLGCLIDSTRRGLVLHTLEEHVEIEGMLLNLLMASRQSTAPAA